MPRTASAAPPILAHARELLSRYDVLYCDVWGVVHNGYTAFAHACTALARFRARGGTVILISNAPVPMARVAEMLDYRNVPRDAWDDIVSSGDIALRHIGERGYKWVHTIGPELRDEAFFARLPAEPVEIAHAHAIVCTGLNDDLTETAETYRPVLEAALARRLPFVCANPDLVVDVGGTLYACAGAIADLYERLGGEVFWAGKPHPSAYAAALAAAEQIRNGPVDRRRILAIGDSIRTDIAGAAKAGIDALFIASGIHHREAISDGQISPDRLARLFAPDGPSAIGAMRELVW